MPHEASCTGMLYKVVPQTDEVAEAALLLDVPVGVAVEVILYITIYIYICVCVRLVGGSSLATEFLVLVVCK